MDLKLVTYPHPALLRKTSPIDVVDDEIRTRAKEMLKIMHESHGVGLAAPQVGWSARLLVLNPGDDAGKDEVLVNPRIVRRFGKVVGEEGCLSFPGIFVQVERAKAVEIEYRDLEGATRVEKRDDFVARIVQHEMDHLDNILLLHRMSPADRVKWKADLESLAGRR